MTPTQEITQFPVFGDNATKIQPDQAKYAAGFQESDVLPAEWLNWFMNKSSAGITALNAIGDSTQKELNNVLQAGGITPAAEDNSQVYNAIKGFIQNTINLVICSTAADVPPAATDNSVVTALFDKLRLTVMIKNGYYGEDDETAMTFNYKGLGAKKVYVPKDGELIEVPSKSVDRTGVARNWFCQPYTKYELEYDATLNESVGGWIVLNNPVVLSSSSEVTYADGTTVYNKHSVDDRFSSYLTQKTFTATQTGIDTGLSVNGGSLGRVYLLLCSAQWDTGNSTASAIYMIRCGYNGNNWDKVTISEARISTSYPLNISVTANGTLKLQSKSGVWRVTVISNKPVA